MGLNLMKHILGLTFRPSSDICCTLRKSYSPKYYLLAPGSFHELSSKRCLVSQTSYQREEILSKNDKNPIPPVEASGLSQTNHLENLNVITSKDISLIKETETDVLEPCNEDVSDIGPFVLPSFHLAAYVNNSYTLQQFVKMGVQLHMIDIKEGAAQSILKLDFEKHVKPCLRFLHDVGVPAEELGKFVTKNPFIFEQNLEDLQVRINYLTAKKFTTDGISRIVTRSPLWLNYSTVDIDKRLGFFQTCFILSGDEVRMLAVKRPQLITYNLRKITDSHFSVKEIMGFDEVETKALLLRAPKIFHINVNALKSRFDYIHNIMGLSHERILQEPDILLFREFIVRQRHEFLKELGKAQYDPKLTNYVSLDILVHGSDVDFCRNVAKTSIDVFNTFLKAR